MKKILLSIAVTICCICAQGQVILEGRILEKVRKEPVPYANIGIPKVNVGTISNLDGSFSIRIPEMHRQDTLLISALGFGRRSIPISQLVNQNGQQILLEEESIVLKPVTVIVSREKNQVFELGNDSFRGGTLEEDTLYAGRSMALLIENSDGRVKGMEFPVYLERARLRILRNNLSTVKFRVRINAIDQTGVPGMDLLQHSVVVESDMRNGWLEFDLAECRIYLTGPFFVTFEQILDLKGRTAIAEGYKEFMRVHPERLKIDTVEFEGKKVVREMISSGGIDLPGTFIAINSSPKAHAQYTCYTRKSSFAKWEKVRGIVTATVTVSTQGRR